MSRQTFGKARRLLDSGQYKQVFDSAQFRASRKTLLILGNRNTQPHPRLGVVVSKKNARRAVDRNRIKRIIREQFRLHQFTLPAVDLVVLARPGLVKQPKQEIARLMKTLLQEIEKQDQ